MEFVKVDFDDEKVNVRIDFKNFAKNFDSVEDAVNFAYNIADNIVLKAVGYRDAENSRNSRIENISSFNIKSLAETLDLPVCETYAVVMAFLKSCQDAMLS